MTEFTVKLHPKDTLSLQRELVCSLKFHHRGIFQKLSKELALQAMHEAWALSQSSNQDTWIEENQGQGERVSTEIGAVSQNPKRQIFFL